MKVFVASLLILALLIAGGIICDLYLQSIADNIGSYTDQIDRAAQEKDYTAVKAVYADLMSFWEKNERFLTALVDHAHTVEVDKSLKELEMGLAVEEDVEILLSSAKVRMEIVSIANDEHFHLKNIL